MIFFHDSLAIALAWLLSLLARFNFEQPPNDLLQAAIAALPVVLLIQVLVGGYFGLYRGLWRFTGLSDFWNLLKAVGLGTIIIFTGLFVFNRLEDIPRSTIVLHPVFLVLLLGGSRLIYRLVKDGGSIGVSGTSGKKSLIVGAGTAGEAVVREMMREEKFTLLGIVDDDKRLLGARIHGVPVLGSIENLPDLVQKMSVDLIIIAVPSASDVEMQRIFEICNKSGASSLTLPKLNDIVEGKVALREARALSIDDLLGRAQVSLDWSAINKNIKGKKVLVTGGGGSIGSELCQQICTLQPSNLVVFDQNEYSLYQLERDIRKLYPDVSVEFVLGDVCDSVRVAGVFEEFRPTIVFHAAAYKHVPILERQVEQAIQNNVLGTKVLAECSVRNQVDSFVLISTDKAVRPTSMMGVSKRLAELCCLYMNTLTSTKFITVRFGNVLNSAGSVVPLFKEQIDKGGPVTVTHKDATRYFMSIPEACQLILEASAMGRGGDVYVLDMGEPVSITYLAEQMIKLSGSQPGKDIQIIYTGLRPGEKIEEELFFSDENLRHTGNEKLLLSNASNRCDERISIILGNLEKSVAEGDVQGMKKIMKGFVEV
tara:strand:- start:484 stop:2274 length:1791 start_codon:yes stop_codon:yes gene_type:complete